MNDALCVRRFEGFDDLLGDRERLINGNRTLCDAIRECRAFDQLHHQRAGPVRFLQTVDRRDVRIIELREYFGLTLEPREAFRVARNRLWQHLDGHRALQVSVGGAIYLPHPPRADWGDHFIRAETTAGSQSHAEPAAL